jgi:hypothetical protein
MNEERRTYGVLCRVLACPQCRADLTREESVVMSCTVAGRSVEVPTRLVPVAPEYEGCWPGRWRNSPRPTDLRWQSRGGRAKLPGPRLGPVRGQ